MPNPRTLARLAAVMTIVAALGCDKDKTGKGTDEPCESVDECGGIDPSCIDLGDGITRCESMCLRDDDCGSGAACIFAQGDVPGEGSTPGVCWRTCSEAEDCSTGAWSCDPIIADSDQGYCTLPLE